MKFPKSPCYLLCMLSLVAIPAVADTTTTAPGTQADVTMMVIPDAHDVAKTVAHVISVPPATATKKPGPAPLHGKPAGSPNEFGKQTADAAKQIEETRESPQAAQHEAEESVEQAAQQAEQAAQSQAEQAQQALQQAQDARNKHEHPNPPPPPPPPPGG